MAVSALKHEGVLYVRAVLVLTGQGPHGGARQLQWYLRRWVKVKSARPEIRGMSGRCCALGLLVFVSIRLGMPQYATEWRGW